MKKLTAEKCREMISNINRWFEDDGFISTSAEFHLQAYQIALPILERQPYESIIAEHLEAVKDSLTLTPHQNAIISCAIDRINILTKRTLDLSRDLIEQQESEGATNE